MPSGSLRQRAHVTVTSSRQRPRQSCFVRHCTHHFPQLHDAHVHHLLPDLSGEMRNCPPYCTRAAERPRSSFSHSLIRASRGSGPLRPGLGPAIGSPMHWSCLAILPGCFQVRSEALEIDDQRLLVFAFRPRRSTRLPSSSCVARMRANSSTGSAVSICARSRSLSASATFG
jgi:hypothetical protein